ncbi:hypothetical protein QQF73_15270 [Marinobacter sp. M216]|uniref:Uncharacterized protein n=1 Tax=Marinobacter albus TaxID=3030833 RepID=A0ABT7HG76_9GAMM|nr:MULTISPECIES: hypothetical protein [unclassified Marinobacter]MBW7472444.1 hypothetical protein [Marinobacter sp. F4218]MDK9558994.1 hypothetical protein [Marinobacter sp. M216]
MKPTHYFAILIRLFAIALVIYTVRQSSVLVEVLTSGGIQDYGVPAGFAWVSVLCPLVVALLLWFFPMTVSASIIRPELDQPIEPMSAPSILTVLVLAIGLYVLYFAISDTVYWLTLWQMSGDKYSESTLYLGGESKAAMVTTVVELLLAVLLVARARTVSGLMLNLTR